MVVELGFNSTSVKIPKVSGSIVVAIRHRDRVEAWDSALQKRQHAGCCGAVWGHRADVSSVK